MKVIFSQFHITHKKKTYAVKFTPQDVTDNRTRFTVEISAADGTVLGTLSGSGRQSISPWNATEQLRRCLEDRGELKVRKSPGSRAAEKIGEFVQEEKILKSKAGDLPNEFGVYQVADQRIAIEPLKSVKSSAEILVLELENGKFISACSCQVGDSYIGSGLSIHDEQFNTRGEAIVDKTKRIRQGLKPSNKKDRRIIKFTQDVETAIDGYNAAQPERIELYQGLDEWLNEEEEIEAAQAQGAQEAQSQDQEPEFPSIEIKRP